MNAPIRNHFLQIPGPTNSPHAVLQASARPTIDHRGSEFAEETMGLLADLKRIFGTTQPVVVYPCSGTGAWEAALVNVLSPGDHILAYETGHFSSLWRELAERLGLVVDYVPGDWRSGVDAERIFERLSRDRTQKVKAVTVVHNETSTGVTSDIPAVRSAIDAAGHSALLLVDTISSLGSIPYEHEGWKVDVTIAASQKGLMVPPGLGFNAVSAKALEASQHARLPRAYWSWRAILAANEDGFFPYTPATNLLMALRTALNLLEGEGMAAVYARHARYAAATRAAVEGWGLEVVCRNPKEYSHTLTGVVTPEQFHADLVRQRILQSFDMSLGAGLGRHAGKIFRIGHVGAMTDLTLAGALCGIEMGLGLSSVPIKRAGVTAALNYLEATLPVDI